ncbi:MAG: flagellar hook-basal body complex protein FliE [Candidatus Thermoplasmatota archaeon]|nr:flagellar hook-basal body complex protein FliE [Candidatus Thermoplasmatota archaeon]
MDSETMILVTGMPGAGKDEFISVANYFGFKDVHMGNTVRKYAVENGIELRDHEVGAFASKEREKHGMHIWAQRTCLYIEDNENTIIDGLRNYEELEYFQKKFSTLSVVAIFANRRDRLSRIMKRNRPDDIKSEAELLDRDNRELSWGLGNLIALADYMLVNDSTLEVFKDRTSEFMKTHILR